MRSQRVAHTGHMSRFGAGHDIKSAARTRALLQLRLWPEHAVVIVPIGPRNNGDVRTLLPNELALYHVTSASTRHLANPVARTGPGWQNSTEDINQLRCRQIQHLISERFPSLDPRPWAQPMAWNCRPRGLTGDCWRSLTECCRHGLQACSPHLGERSAHLQTGYLLTASPTLELRGAPCGPPTDPPHVAS